MDIAQGDPHPHRQALNLNAPKETVGAALFRALAIVIPGDRAPTIKG